MGAVAVITAPGEDLSDEDLQALVATSSGNRDNRQTPVSCERGASGPGRQWPRERLARGASARASWASTWQPWRRLDPVDGSPADVERAARPSLLPRRAADRSRRASGRHKIAALLAGPPDATETIVFLHGLGGSQSTWASVLGAFAETYRIAAVDLPGHGASDKPSPESTDYSIPGIAARSASFSKSWSLRLPCSSATLSAARRHCSWRSTVQSSSALALVDSAALGLEINGELLDRVESAPSRDEARRLLELFFEDRRFVLERGIDDMYAAAMRQALTTR